MGRPYNRCGERDTDKLGTVTISHLYTYLYHMCACDCMYAHVCMYVCVHVCGIHMLSGVTWQDLPLVRKWSLFITASCHRTEVSTRNRRHRGGVCDAQVESRIRVLFLEPPFLSVLLWAGYLASEPLLTGSSRSLIQG